MHGAYRKRVSELLYQRCLEIYLKETGRKNKVKSDVIQAHFPQIRHHFKTGNTGTNQLHALTLSYKEEEAGLAVCKKN